MIRFILWMIDTWKFFLFPLLRPTSRVGWKSRPFLDRIIIPLENLSPNSIWFIQRSLPPQIRILNLGIQSEAVGIVQLGALQPEAGGNFLAHFRHFVPTIRIFSVTGLDDPGAQFNRYILTWFLTFCWDFLHMLKKLIGANLNKFLNQYQAVI